MKYGEIKKLDIANGPGVRVSLFVSGCTHHCPGCFNSSTWNFDFGFDYTQKVQKEVLESLAPEHVSGMTVLGGEPFEPSNQRFLTGLLRAVKEKYPQKSIWIYSGYLFDKEIMPEKFGYLDDKGNVLKKIEKKAVYSEKFPSYPEENEVPVSGIGIHPETGRALRNTHCEVTDELVSYIEVLVDGPFIMSKKNLSLKFRGSANQRLIDVAKSLERAEIVLWEK